MAEVAALQPIYDDRVKIILKLLKGNHSREEVAEKFRYASYRSLDEYMRRKNFRWDKREGTYIPANAIPKLPTMAMTNFPTDKVRRVVTEMGKEKANPKETALKIGFENHLEMASYMKSKGFEWSQELGNYERVSQSSSNCVGDDTAYGMDVSLVESVPTTKGDDLEGFHPLLEWLTANKENLEKMIREAGASEAIGQIPRFTLPGLLVTKSVHMTNTLDHMVRDFSKEKNINQREIFEVALIEFFQKYGFVREIETLLKKNV